jgi:hypothetical protein
MDWDAPPAPCGEFYIKHRTAQERSGSGVLPDPLPWNYVGPFATFDAASARWREIAVNWQEGGVVKKCAECGQDRAP